MAAAVKMAAAAEKTVADDIKKKLKLRDATTEDYLQVVRLSRGIYAGQDYLPAKFHNFVRDPDICMTVAELDGKLIGLKYLKFVDNGNTIIGGGARIDADHRNSGIWRMLRNHLPERKAKRFVIASTEWSLYRQVLRRRDSTLQHMIMRRLVAYLHHPHGFLAPSICPHPVSHHHVVSLDKRDSLDVLLNADNQIRLFPHRTIVSAWEPFRILKSNLERVLTNNCCQLATKDTTEKDPSAVVSFSMAQISIVPNGTRYELEYYGSDPEDLYVHLTHHLNYIVPRTMHDGIDVTIMMGACFDRQLVENVVAMVNGLTVTRGIMPAYFLEAPLTDEFKANL